MIITLDLSSKELDLLCEILQDYTQPAGDDRWTPPEFKYLANKIHEQLKLELPFKLDDYDNEYIRERWIES